MATRKHIADAGKTRYEVYDNTPPTGVTGIPLPDMTAHRTAVIYVHVNNKPASGTFTLNVYEDSQPGDPQPMSVGGITVPHGETTGRARIVLDPATGIDYHVELSNPSEGTHVKIVMVAG